MDESVTRSEEGQLRPKPTREQRDAAFSSGGGRKAQEVPKEERAASDSQAELEPPVGLDLETKADQDL